MNFENDKVLWLAAAAAPLLSLFLWGTWRKRQALIRQFVQNKALAQMSLGIAPSRQKLRRILLLVSVMFLLLALARPQWGFVWEEAAQRGRDIVVAIDTSRSMLAQDIQPNRLERAKLAALDLMKLGKYDRFGLVAFAGTAFLQCPLTFDEEAFRQSVQILEPGILPQGGTALSAAITAAREAFSKDGDDNHKIVVLFTDGEDHEEGVLETVQDAVTGAVRIFTVGAGTPAGEVLRVRDERGNQVFVKDAEGNVVKSRLNENLLRDIATRAHGFYLPLNAPNAMEVLYDKGLKPLPTSEHSSKLMKRLKEQYFWPLGIAILLLFLEVFVPEQKRTLRRKPGSAVGSLASAATLLFLLLTASESGATPSSAYRKYQDRQFKGALSEYQRLIEKNPNDPRLRYNAGAAAYQANKFDEALSQFQAAAASPDLDLQQQSFYNLGNTEYQLGESNPKIEERIQSWEKAIQNYETALRLNSGDQDAAYNRDLVKKKLDELKKQQQQQQSKSPDNQERKNEDKEKQDEQQKNNENPNQQGDQQQNQPKPNNEQNSQNQQQQNQEEQQKKEAEENQKNQQASQKKQDEQKKAEQSQAQKQGGEKESDESKPQDEGENARYAQMGKMTPAQAKQLLDAQRSEEKALLFIPQERKSTPKDRVFKDW